MAKASSKVLVRKGSRVMHSTGGACAGRPVVEKNAPTPYARRLHANYTCSFFSNLTGMNGPELSDEWIAKVREQGLA